MTTELIHCLQPSPFSKLLDPPLLSHVNCVLHTTSDKTPDNIHKNKTYIMIQVFSSVTRPKQEQRLRLPHSSSGNPGDGPRGLDILLSVNWLIKVVNFFATASWPFLIARSNGVSPLSFFLLATAPHLHHVYKTVILSRDLQYTGWLCLLNLQPLELQRMTAFWPNFVL